MVGRLDAPDIRPRCQGIHPIKLRPGGQSAPGDNKEPGASFGLESRRCRIHHLPSCPAA